MTLDSIRDAIDKNKFRISKHAQIEMHKDEFDLDDVLLSVENGKIIEDYPGDKRSPSCLVFGYSYNHRPIHSVWGLIDKVAICVTVYKPEATQWDNFEIRRKKWNNF